MGADNIFSDIPVIERDRFILRKIRLTDIDDFFEYSSNPEVTRYLSYDHKTKEDAMKYLVDKQAKYESGQCMIWGIEYKDDGKFIGACGFTNWNQEHRTGEIAYTLSQKYWGKGIASELVKELIDFGFVRMKLNRIEARCWVDNIRSSRLMEKFDMKFEGILREQVLVKGNYEDIKIYSILHKEYKELCSKDPG